METVFERTFLKILGECSQLKRQFINLFVLLVLVGCGGSSSNSTLEVNGGGAENSPKGLIDVQGVVVDIPNIFADVDLKVSSIYDSAVVKTDGDYAVGIPGSGNTLVILEANDVPILMSVMTPELSKTGYLIDAHSTAKALGLLTGLFSTPEGINTADAELFLKKLDSYGDLVQYIQVGLQSNAWVIDGTNIGLREKLHALMEEAISVIQQSNDLNKYAFKEEVIHLDGDLENPEPSREINTLQIVDTSRIQNNFLYRIQNRGKRWVNVIVKTRKETDTGDVIFEQVGGNHLIPSPAVSFLDYMDYISGTIEETPAIVWPDKKYAAFFADVNATEELKIIILGSGAGNVAQVDGLEEEEALATAMVASNLFDIIGTTFEMLTGIRSFDLSVNASLMLPQEAITQLIERSVKKFFEKQTINTRNEWLFQLQQGEVGLVMSDVTASIMETLEDDPDLLISIMQPYLSDKILVTSLMATTLIKRVTVYLTLFDIGGAAYNLIHTAIDRGTLDVRTEFRYRKYDDENPDDVLPPSSDSGTGYFKITRIENESELTADKSNYYGTGTEIKIYWESDDEFWKNNGRQVAILNCPIVCGASDCNLPTFPICGIIGRNTPNPYIIPNGLACLGSSLHAGSSSFSGELLAVGGSDNILDSVDINFTCHVQ